MGVDAIGIAIPIAFIIVSLGVGIIPKNWTKTKEGEVVKKPEPPQKSKCSRPGYKKEWCWMYDLPGYTT